MLQLVFLHMFVLLWDSLVYLMKETTDNAAIQ